MKRLPPALSSLLLAVFTPHALLGATHFLGGDKQSAARRFERALAPHPQNTLVAGRLKQLKQK